MCTVDGCLFLPEISAPVRRGPAYDESYYERVKFKDITWYVVFMDIQMLLACRSRQARIVLERYFRFEISLLPILCMLIARMEMGSSRVSGDSDIIT